MILREAGRLVVLCVFDYSLQAAKHSSSRTTNSRTNEIEEGRLMQRDGRDKRNGWMDGLFITLKFFQIDD